MMWSMMRINLCRFRIIEFRWNLTGDSYLRGNPSALPSDQCKRWQLFDHYTNGQLAGVSNYLTCNHFDMMTNFCIDFAWFLYSIDADCPLMDDWHHIVSPLWKILIHYYVLRWRKIGSKGEYLRDWHLYVVHECI